MNEPIIKPLWIYFISLATPVKTAVIIIGVLFVLVNLIRMINDDDFKVKWNGIVGTIIILAGLFIPSSNTVTAMVIAKNVTYEVVDETGKVLKNSVDYMFDKIKDFKNGQEN